MFLIYLFCIVLFILRIINLKRFEKSNSINKQNTYECRYTEIFNSSILYSSQFFVLALSFILFDLEIVFFLPYFITFYYSKYSSYMLLFFLIFLLFRLYYELSQKLV